MRQPPCLLRLTLLALGGRSALRRSGRAAAQRPMSQIIPRRPDERPRQGHPKGTNVANAVASQHQAWPSSLGGCRGPRGAWRRCATSSRRSRDTSQISARSRRGACRASVLSSTSSRSSARRPPRALASIAVGSMVRVWSAPRRSTVIGAPSHTDCPRPQASPSASVLPPPSAFASARTLPSPEAGEEPRRPIRLLSPRWPPRSRLPPRLTR